MSGLEPSPKAHELTGPMSCVCHVGQLAELEAQRRELLGVKEGIWAKREGIRQEQVAFLAEEARKAAEEEAAAAAAAAAEKKKGKK